MKNTLKYLALPLLAAVAIACLYGCQEEPVDYARGAVPTLDGQRAVPVISFKSRNGAGNLVKKNFFNYLFTDAVNFSLDVPATEAVEIQAVVSQDQALVDAYNLANGRDAALGMAFRLCPVEAVSFQSGDVMRIEAGGLLSNTIPVSVSYHALESLNYYLLPVTYTVLGGTASKDPVYTTVYYEISVNWMAQEDNLWAQWGEKDFTTVGYINTKKVLPQKATQRYYYVMLEEEPWEEYWRYFDILNLNETQIRYSVAEGRPVLYLDPDITYLLNHRDKYIAPVQETGIKVCLVIKGGNTGIGFCNLNDAQIADFTAQVKAVVEKFGLDGVNLWDEGAGYGMEGMPGVNLTSYLKLIKALDGAMPDKLVTLVDVGEPTASFDVAQAGVSVGEHIDYAWNMYPLEYIDPWKPGSKRKPILGLDKRNYGGYTMDAVMARNQEDQGLRNSTDAFTEILDLIATGLGDVLTIADIIDFVVEFQGDEANYYDLFFLQKQIT
jgi:hypothetical protein